MRILRVVMLYLIVALLHVRSADPVRAQFGACTGTSNPVCRSSCDGELPTCASICESCSPLGRYHDTGAFPGDHCGNAAFQCPNFSDARVWRQCQCGDYCNEGNQCTPGHQKSACQAGCRPSAGRDACNCYTCEPIPECKLEWVGCSSNDECCSGSCSDEHYCQPNASPILINVNSMAFSDHLTDAAHGVRFDVTADGHAEQVAWTRPQSAVGFLVLDRNANGTIDDGSELFGNHTPRLDGTTATNGFEALRDLDGDANGRVDAQDPSFSALRLWFDRNHDGQSSVDELMTLSSVGVTSVGTVYRETNIKDRHGNWYRFLGIATLEQGGRARARAVFDVFLTTEFGT